MLAATVFYEITIRCGIISACSVSLLATTTLDLIRHLNKGKSEVKSAKDFKQKIIKSDRLRL